MPRESEARGIVSRGRIEARALAYKTIRSVQRNLLSQGYVLKCCGLLLACGRALPSLPQILESHALIHTADGELFRHALIHASERCGLEIFTVKERELMDKSYDALRLKSDEINRRLTDLGIGYGPPWTQDEKFASLIAWLSLTHPRMGSRAHDAAKTD